jgi:hypothetical protein
MSFGEKGRKDMSARIELSLTKMIDTLRECDLAPRG